LLTKFWGVEIGVDLLNVAWGEELFKLICGTIKLLGFDGPSWLTKGAGVGRVIWFETFGVWLIWEGIEITFGIVFCRGLLISC
jgi:hypothetical protein